MLTHSKSKRAGFLSTTATYFNQSINQSAQLKYALFVAHDGSIMAVMNTLGVQLTQTPPYAVDLNFTLIENNHQYYVIITFNNKPVSIPACNNSNRCTLAQFIDLNHNV